MAETLAFYAFSAVAIGAATLVIGQRNPMYSVLLLIATFGALSGLYIQLDAPFVAVAQIIIYAGAIMVLFLFVVMLLNAPREDAAEWDRSHPLHHPNIGRFGGLLATLLVVQLAWALVRATDLETPVGARADSASVGSVARWGASCSPVTRLRSRRRRILILVAMVGAVVLARREGGKQ